MRVSRPTRLAGAASVVAGLVAIPTVPASAQDAIIGRNCSDSLVNRCVAIGYDEDDRFYVRAGIQDRTPAGEYEVSVNRVWLQYRAADGQDWANDDEIYSLDTTAGGTRPTRRGALTSNTVTSPIGAGCRFARSSTHSGRAAHLPARSGEPAMSTWSSAYPDSSYFGDSHENG